MVVSLAVVAVSIRVDGSRVGAINRTARADLSRPLYTAEPHVASPTAYGIRILERRHVARRACRGAGRADYWFSNALTLRDRGHEIPFAVRLGASGRLVGSTRFLDPVPRHKRVEIGATWYCPDVWGTVVNTECKLLLLRHAFEVAGANRVELCTDLLNRRSQSAIAKLGAVREGVLRAHMVVKQGRVRDSVLYSITKADWPAVKATLERDLEKAQVPT